MRTTSVARWVSEAKTPWAWRFGKRCLPKREFWKSGLPRAQNDTRRRRARSDNPKAGFAKSKRRGVQIPLACGLGHRTALKCQRALYSLPYGRSAPLHYSATKQKRNSPSGCFFFCRVTATRSTQRRARSSTTADIFIWRLQGKRH